MDFEPVRKARLTQGEFAKLVGVSRVTANTWLRESNPANPHRLLQFTVATQLQRIAEAVAVGMLPLPGTVMRSEREKRLREVLDIADRQIQLRVRSAATNE